MIRDDDLTLVALSRVSGLGPRRFSQLYERIGSLSGIRSASNATLSACDIPASVVEEIGRLNYELTEEDSYWLAQDGHQILSILDARYPSQLKTIDQAPLVLYAKGRVELLDGPGLSIVGTRHPTSAGLENAARFAEQLAGAGLTIISGLALGVDAAAHRGAMQQVGGTVAVMGCGLDRVYPARNRGLAREIAEHGLLLSEFAPGTEARAEYFPRRNRIISGLGLGVLVVEAALKSGTLVTARYAMEQGRDVFAIPGSIHSPTYKGCHWLIKQGAKLVESADDILEELRPHIEGILAPSSEPLEQDRSSGLDQLNLDQDYKNLLKTMGFEPVLVDELVMKTGLTSAEVSSMLLLLELEGVVKPSAGGRYQRVG